MAVVIRLSRAGSKKRPFYHMVVADSRMRRDGRFIERVGYYNPLPKQEEIVINEERIQAWIAQGAKPSDTVNRLISRSRREAPAGDSFKDRRRVKRQAAKAEAAKLEATAAAEAKAKADAEAKAKAKAEAAAAAAEAAPADGEDQAAAETEAAPDAAAADQAQEE